MFQETKKHQLIKLFQLLGGQISDDSARKLYTNLFQEEYKEFLDGYYNLKLNTRTLDDLNLTLDGLGDKIVIMLGAYYHGSRAADYFSKVIETSFQDLKETINESVLLNQTDIVDIYGLVSDCFDEIMVSNFSKFCSSLEEAKLSQEKYLLEYGIETKIKEIDMRSKKSEFTEIDLYDTYYTVLSSKEQTAIKDLGFVPENKILKSINYRKPNINTIIFRHFGSFKTTLN